MRSYYGAENWGGWRRRGVVGVLCGAHALALVAHVPFMCLLRLREVLMHVGDGDEGPGEVISISVLLNQVAFVGKPAAAWRYLTALSMLGSS